MNGNYLIPANSKKSMLYFGLFNMTDLIIFGVGIGLTLLLLMIVPLNDTAITILVLLPGLLSGFLVMPIPYHHNMLTFLLAIYEFYSTRQRFIWRGWCVMHGSDNEK